MSLDFFQIFSYLRIGVVSLRLACVRKGFPSKAVLFTIATFFLAFVDPVIKYFLINFVIST